ncbi:hypothetical protein [Edwardsiella tarda]
MKKRLTTGTGNDRFSVSKNNPHTPGARERVIAGLLASATANFIFIIRWLTTGISNGEPIPLVKCENLRNTISHLETLKAGIQPDWRKTGRRANLMMYALPFGYSLWQRSMSAVLNVIKLRV